MSRSAVAPAKVILWAGAALATAYLGFCLALRAWQTRLIFFPSSVVKATPAAVNLPYETVRLPVAGGQVYGWWIASALADSPVLLYLHGNSSNIGDLVGRASRFHQLGLSVLLIDYRGYGYSSTPFPNESRVYEDAEAAWLYLTQTRQIAPKQIFLYGQSLGGAIAIELATRHPEAAGVIVESSFTSMRAMVDSLSPYPLLPVDWILTQSFNSLAKVRSLRVPILLIHGTADREVPAQMSQDLFAAAPEPKQLLLIPQADHNNTVRLGGTRYLKTIEAFVRKHSVKVSP
jgi:pimeloyl-ACP methyl ester carboxylesterase